MAFEKLACAEVPVAVQAEEGSPHRALLAGLAGAILRGSAVDLPLRGGKLASALAERAPVGRSA